MQQHEPRNEMRGWGVEGRSGTFDFMNPTNSTEAVYGGRTVVSFILENLLTGWDL